MDVYSSVFFTRCFILLFIYTTMTIGHYRSIAVACIDEPAQTEYSILWFITEWLPTELKAGLEMIS